MGIDAHVARDAVRLVTLSGVDDIPAALALVGEFLEEPARAALVTLALAHMVSIFVADIAETRHETRDQVLVRMLDGALRRPL